MKPKILTTGLCCLAATAALISTSEVAWAADKKPNVVIIITDDIGWGDLGCYGGGVTRGAPTPNLDRLAAEGARFTAWYGQASCTAGRASCITGRIPIGAAMGSDLPEFIAPNIMTGEVKVE